MSKREDFSVAIITKNEANVLPKLLASLEGVDDIVVLDTGSTDKTVEIAKKHGCNVIEVGDKFKVKATKKQVEEWKKNNPRMEPTFKAGKGYFHFSKARNYAASFTKNDWVFQPDADEVVEWDLEKVRDVIQNEDHLIYQFCYQYAPDGTCGLEFPHSKFFRKSKMKWTKWVHEIHTPVEGQTPKPPKFVDFIYHKHYQEPKLERGNYLPGLELSVLENPEDDRNVYYLAREYFYNQRYTQAINMFDKARAINHWPPEKGQACIYQAKCHWEIGEKDKAIELLHESIEIHDERREPFWELGNYYKELEDWNKAITYHLAATGVPFKEQGYLNSKELYSWKIEDSLAFLYGKIGDFEKSKNHWLNALKNNPPKEVLNGYKWFYKEQPLISIVVPTVRPEGYKRLVDSIEKNTVYENYELVPMAEDNGTAVEKFNDGVKKSRGELIVYLADDCTVQQGWLVQAFSCLNEKLNGRGLVILNDNYWKGALANHFLINKDIRDELDGEIWHSGYNHCGVDVELLHRLKAKKLDVFCKEARINHLHYFAPTKGVSPDKADKYSDRVNKNMETDRVLLSNRLWELGLTEAAKENVKFFKDMYGRLPGTDLLGDLDGPERAVVGKNTPVPLYENARYAWASKQAIGEKVLDIGCSSGFGSRFFEDKEYTGIDYNKDIIDYAKTQYPGNTFIHADINTFEIGFYDTIISFECIEHLEDGKKIAQSLKNHCNKLLLSVPYKEPVGAWGKYHLMHNLMEKDFPGFTYKWMRPDGKIYDKPGTTGFNLMLMVWEK